VHSLFLAVCTHARRRIIRPHMRHALCSARLLRIYANGNVSVPSNKPKHIVSLETSRNTNGVSHNAIAHVNLIILLRTPYTRKSRLKARYRVIEERKWGICQRSATFWFFFLFWRIDYTIKRMLMTSYMVVNYLYNKVYL